MLLFRPKLYLRAVAGILVGCLSLTAQQPEAPQGPISGEQLQKLMERLSADEARIKELENKLISQQPATSKDMAGQTIDAKAIQSGSQPAAPTPAPSAPAEPPVVASTSPLGTSPTASDEMHDPHDHMIELPGGGPALKIRGFFDFDLGVGTDANPLIFPLAAYGTAVHNTFQAGEFDLFMSSKLSDRLSFVSELVIGSDPTNYWGLDIERLQLTYKASKYFEISAGRYHSAIGYYNTAFHHGTWFQTATGRPFMYFFEDSGGILPVHNVGVTTTGLVPGTDRLGLHWVVEAGNGRNSDPAGQPVQNFLSDRNHKAFNVAAYIAPEWARGLQIGGSYYRDRMMPVGIPHVQQDIESAYAVYITPTWEFMNEAVALNNRIDGQPRVFHTPLMYTQLSRKFGMYRPFVRYQYVNSMQGDPVNIYTGRYTGPSVGLRIDFADYAAFKLQYNRLYQNSIFPVVNNSTANGLDTQVAFTF
ncbi:MAG TPA: hypothetical protein VH325_17645 [Bryobacteraceae bacterium]|jgi:hypothetical protein|nr:hypothetical protein [Bryobacteraceae bacterium]